MAAELLGALTGAALVGVLAVYLGLLLMTVVFAVRGMMDRAMVCGVAFLTMMFPLGGLFVLIGMLVYGMVTRDIQPAVCSGVGFVVAIAVYAVLVAVLGIGIAVGA